MAQVLVPLCLVGASTAVVLCGDHKQLGASVRNPVARAGRLGVSLQERLMATSLAPTPAPEAPNGGGGGSGGGGSGGDGARLPGVAVETLVSNYRSHGAILAVPSAMFYDSSLEERADASTTHSLLAWEGLPAPDLPLLFFGVNGVDMSEVDSPSYFNLVRW